MRIIIADDCSQARRGLASLLDEQVGIDLIGEAADADELLELVNNEPVDVIILAYGLPGSNLEELIDLIRKLNQSSRIFVLSSDVEKARHAFSAGTDVFISKDSQSKWIFEVIQRLQKE